MLLAHTNIIWLVKATKLFPQCSDLSCVRLQYSICCSCRVAQRAFHSMFISMVLLHTIFQDLMVCTVECKCSICIVKVISLELNFRCSWKLLSWNFSSLLHFEIINMPQFRSWLEHFKWQHRILEFWGFFLRIYYRSN